MPRSRSRSDSRGRARDKSPPKRSRSRSPRGKRSPSPQTKIVVENLSRNVGEEHLKEIFSTFGVIKSSKLLFDTRINLPKGQGNVEYEKKEEAEEAIAAMDGAQVDGNIVAVKFLSKALPPPPPPPDRRSPPPRRP
eukprot:2118666-Rhodomonas_salina.1